MATASSLKNELSKKQSKTEIGSTVKGLLSNGGIKKRFEEVLNQKAPQYMSSIVNLVNGDTNLQKCDPMSVVASCMVAATMDLPVDKNLGYAWVVPYKNKAQFQMGYKGYVQLALRTGQYKSINVIEVHEGELEEWNPLTEKLKIDFSKKESDSIIGYAGYFELLNGFKKSTYWTKDQIIKHKNKFSKSDFGWNKDFDAMAKKTVLRNMLSKWGILSIEMQNAYTADSNIIKDAIVEDSDVQSNIEYINTDFEVKDENQENNLADN
ncbi:recombinase RecT [Clostridium novyi]